MSLWLGKGGGHCHFGSERQDKTTLPSQPFLIVLADVLGETSKFYCCSSVTPLPHVRSKVTLDDDIQLLFPIHFNVLL